MILRLHNLKLYLLIGLRLCICDLCRKDFETFILAILNIKKDNYILIDILVKIFFHITRKLWIVLSKNKYTYAFLSSYQWYLTKLGRKKALATIK